MRVKIQLALPMLLLASICVAAPQRDAPTISIQVTDKATGDPIAQADVEVGNRKSITDEFGQCTIPAAMRGRAFAIEVFKAGYITAEADWRHMQPDQKLPDQIAFAMEPGSSIGGKVVDESGNPVAGAVIELLGPEPNHSDGQVYSQLHSHASTDNSGAWSMNTAPTRLDSVFYTLTANGFLHDNSFHEIPSVKQLRDRSLVLTVRHGVSLTGIVLDPLGQPVSHATITSGDSEVRSRARSDSDGTFTLNNLTPGTVKFAVTSDDFAPLIASATVPATQPTQVHLQPGTSMKFHVTDHIGTPLPNVSIYVAQYRDAPYARYSMKTDANGNATWKGAPADEIVMNIWKKTWGIIVDRPMTATTRPIEIKLGARTHITATVIDAVTGEPIKNFTVLPGMIAYDSDETYWSNDAWAGTITNSHDGRFSYSPEQPYPKYQLRVQAPGYLPIDSMPFDNVSAELPLQFKLVKGVGIVGVVYGADHKLLANATVHIVLGNRPLQLQSHGVVGDWIQDVAPMQTDAQGHFGFAPKADAFALVCVTPDGYARLNAPSLHPSKQPPGVTGLAPYPTTRPSSYDLTLQPWATVQGKLMVGSKPGAHIELGLQMINPNWDGHQPQVYLDYIITTSADGQFKFDHVPPGKVQVAKIIRTGDSQSFSAEVTAEVKPGETAIVNMGGTGRPVIGKFDIPSSFPHGNWIAWNGSLRPHMASLKGPPMPDMPLAIRKGSAEARLKWVEQWMKTPEGKALMAAQKKWFKTPEGKALMAAAKKPRKDVGQMNFSFVVQPDGTFRIDDVPAGSYELFAQFFPAGIMNGGGDWNHPLGVSRQEIVVPEMPGGRSDEPLDVGTIAVTPPKQMQ